MIKSKVVTICFAAVLSALMLGNIILPDSALSYSERRKLAQAPVFSFEKLFSGELFEDFEKYSLDQFIFRDAFRAIKAFGTYYLLNQKDNNDIYIIDGSIIKMEYPLNEKSVLNASGKLNEVYDKYLRGMNVSYAIIPDKNYFAASENDHLKMDYEKMIAILNENVSGMNYIDLCGSLTLKDYYRTDIHWDQSSIIHVANKLFEEMGSDARIDSSEFTGEELHPFYGSYYGQAALKLKPDTLVYLNNSMLEKARVYDYETKTTGKVYVPEKFQGIDPYDVFLSGAKPLLTIENTENKNGRELILFRDSFGSSIAPLLLEGYSRITLIDLRYIATDYIGELMDFNPNADVLFLYNTLVINNSYMLK